MASNLQAIYYRTSDGSQPVDNFIETLPMNTAQRSIASSTGVQKNFVILLHMFRKDTGEVPEADKKIARERLEDFKQRMDASKRVPPRAAGHDAP